jgi:hypothetical protein
MDSVYPVGPQAIPGRLQCAFYDFGGEGIAYHATDPRDQVLTLHTLSNGNMNYAYLDFILRKD